jgi:hypothetical protein
MLFSNWLRPESEALSGSGVAAAPFDPVLRAADEFALGLAAALDSTGAGVEIATALVCGGAVWITAAA